MRVRIGLPFATHDAAMGFCFFNNVAVGVRHALDELGLHRVALIDFDAHHGNGTQDIFAGDERVLMVSIFERGLYPFNSDAADGGNMCNVPLDPYTRGDALREAVLTRWIPALHAFAPEMIFVSAGFDAQREDDMSHLLWVEADLCLAHQADRRGLESSCGRQDRLRAQGGLPPGAGALALARTFER